MTTRLNSLTKALSFRIAFVFIGAILMAVTGLSFYLDRELRDEEAHDAEQTKALVLERIQGMQESHRRYASALASAIDIQRVMTLPAEQRWNLLRTWLVSLNPDTRFDTVLVRDRDGRVVFAHGREAAEFPVGMLVRDVRWYVNASGDELHEVATHPLWLGPDDGLGSIVFLNPMRRSSAKYLSSHDHVAYIAIPAGVVAAADEVRVPLQEGASVMVDGHVWAMQRVEVPESNGVFVMLRSRSDLPEWVSPTLTVSGLLLLGLFAAIYLVLVRWMRSMVVSIRDLGQAVIAYGEAGPDSAPVFDTAIRSVRSRGDALASLGDAFAQMVSDLRQTQHDLRQEKELAQTTLMSIADGVICTDNQGRVTQINAVAERLTGWPAQEAIGQLATQVLLIDEAEQDSLGPLISKVLVQGQSTEQSQPLPLVARDLSRRHVTLSGAAVHRQDQQMAGAVFVLHDVSENQALVEKIQWQALHDALTGLPNRTLLSDRIQQALAHADRSGRKLAVCFVDLDNFKQINDSHGHSTGDAVLEEVAHRMATALRKTDTLARLGGDEFVLLLSELGSPDEAKALLARVRESLVRPFKIEEEAFTVSASIGVTLYPDDAASDDTLLRHADLALYEAKQQGRDRIVFFDSRTDMEIASRSAAMERLRKALVANEFFLVYQPKVNLRTGHTVGLEALIRWQHPERGLVGPIEFIPLLESTHLGNEVGNWVIEQTLLQMESWLANGRAWPVSVNLTGRHAMSASFVDDLKDILARHPKVPSGLLEMEILESAAIEDLDRVASVMAQCRHLGIRFALDDFGTGYSSLAYLKRLPVETLKIDKSFVLDMLTDAGDQAIVEGVVSLAKVFNRSVVAEGVESAEHGVALMRMGCDIVQGYGIARPMPGPQIPGWVDAYQPDPAWYWLTDTDAHSGGYSVVAAKYDHLRWIDEVLRFVDGQSDSLTLSPQEVEDPHRCRFGRWYYGDEGTRHAGLRSFVALEPVHAGIHRLGAEAIRLARMGERQAARASTIELMGLKDQLLDLLDELDRQSTPTPQA